MKIAPTSRLVLLAALLLPAALLAGFSPRALMLALAVYGLVAILTLLDAWAAWHSRGCVSVTIAPVVRLARMKEGQFELLFFHPSQARRMVECGLALPPALVSTESVRRICLPAGTETSCLSWPCQALRRGVYPLQRCRLAWWSPGKLWRVLEDQTLNTEIRVYPDLSREKQRLPNLFLQRGRLGIHHQKQIGKGREFEKLRDYQPGDCFEDIHWKATAKRGMPIVKEFQIERTQEVYVILDASRLSAQKLAVSESETDAEPNSLERYVTAATIFSLICQRQGDLYGLLTFSDRVEAFVRAKSGRAQHQACQQALFGLHPQRVMPDYTEVFTFIRTHLRRRALLIFLTDLRDPAQAEDFQRGVSLIAGQHLVLVTMLQPRGVAPLFQGPPPQSHDHLYEKLGGHLQWQALAQLRQSLQRAGVNLALVEQEQLAARLVDSYISVKQRQVL